MKIIKPSSVSVLQRVVEFKGRKWLCVSGLISIALQPGIRVFSESQLWTHASGLDAGTQPIEHGVFRQKSEYLVVGSAYCSQPQAQCAIEARVGSQRKQLIVHGHRYWNGERPTAAEPFESMPVNWAHAWGGEAIAENPLGIGAAPVERDGVCLHWLPNVEDPRQPVSSPKDRPRPASFGPIDSTWPARTRYHGTYDDAWLKTQFPAIASDTDWRFFNIAPEDQQREQPFTGEEEYAFHHMHPTQPYLTGKLPGLRVRAFVTQRVGQTEKFKEVKTRLNTIWFFPDAERAILIFQGMHEIAEDDAADIVHLLAALEHNHQPRPAEHYLHVRDKRLDKDEGVVEALREEDLAPEELAVSMVDFTPGKDRALERAQRRAETERAKAREEVAGHGLDPAIHAPPVKSEPAPEIRNLDDLLRIRKEMEQLMVRTRQHADAEKAKSLQSAKSAVLQSGQDFSVIEREMAGLATRGPPKPFVEDLLRSFRGHIAAGQSSPAGKASVAELEHMVVDDRLHAQWRSGESGQLMAYRMTAHYQTPVDRIQGEAAQAMRRRVMERQAAGGDFRGWDLTGADLSGLDLTSANLEKALMERANLTGATLRGANLRDAVLAHADFLSTQCQQAVFANANLGAARIEKTDFEGADLSGAIFANAQLSQVSWRGARIDDIRLEEAIFDGLDCAGTHSDQMITFHQLDLRGFNFSQARLRLAAFIECDARGVDFSGAVFEKCAFATLKAEQANFRGMRISSGCFVQQCDLRLADFSGAVLQSMSFRGATLAGATLKEAVLCGSDFSECDLSQANFGGADARSARFVRARLAGTSFAGANLMDAIFQHAQLQDTDYRHANLFQSDFARARVAPGARFDHALTTRMRTLPRHQSPAGGGAAS